MTVVQNEDLTLAQDKPVCIKNFDDFVSSYSPEVVQGYLLALKDIFGEVDQAVNRNANMEMALFLKHPNSVIMRNMLQFHIEKWELIGHFAKEKITPPVLHMKQI